MPDQSTILSLPHILPSQAQKHVTHNEALRLLDVMVQLSVAQRTLATPPVSPALGDRHIVAASPTGAWVSHQNEVALWNGTAWEFFAPLEGWRAYVAEEGAVVVFDGSAWTTPGGIAEFDRLGVAMSADAVNKLAVASEAVLFTNPAGSHRVVINKAAAADTGSVLFQQNYVGHAEFGLAGTNDFSVKVSPDGSSFLTALRTDQTTGRVSLDHPVQLVPAAGDASGVGDGFLWYNSTTGKFRARQGGATVDLIGSGGGAGDVVGPASATDNAIARFDAATGKLLQNAAVTLSDAGDLALPTVDWPLGAWSLERAAGANGALTLANRGTGALQVSAADAAEIRFSTAGTIRARLASTGAFLPGVNLGTNIGELATRFADLFAGKLNLGSSSADGVVVSTGAGSPEAVVTGSVGSVYLRNNGATGTTLYVKESGTGNTGWAALGGASGPTFPDNTFGIVGSADPTKIARFEVDGFAPGVTHTFTLPAGSSTLAILGGTQTFSGLKTFSALMTVQAGLVLTPAASDLASPADGALWYNSTTGKFRARQAGATVDLIGSGGGATNLTYDAATRVIASDTGTDATLPLVVAAGDAGLMTGADKTKLDAISGTNTGDQTITLTGDVTGSGTGSFAATIAPAAVSLAKMANIATDRLIGRDTAGTGVPEAITVGGGIEFSGAGGIQTAAFTGDATKAAGGTALTLATVNGNVGNFGLAGSVAQFAVNAKGLITSAANVAISIAATAISDSTAAGRAMLTAATAAAQTALLDVFTSAAKGLVPASGGGTTNFLRADGTWAAPGGGADPWTYLKLAANNVVNTTALADVTGMTFTATANTTYEIEVFGAMQSAATTTGIALALDIPSGTVDGLTIVPSSATGILYTGQRADNVSTAATTGVSTANLNFPITGKYLVAVGATGGAIQLRQASEVAGSNTTLMAGLRMKYREIPA